MSKARLPLTLERNRGRIRMQLQVLAMGEDLMVLLSGGDRPHLGAMAVSGTFKAEDGPFIASLCMPGHMEEEISRNLSLRLSAALGVTVGVACGIHLDSISRAEIQDVLSMGSGMVDELLSRLL